MGGLVGQIAIQAFVLRALLLLIAKHEADTSFQKVAMVAAGISLGTFVISMFTMQWGLVVTIPAQIAFMAAILMTFCWVSIAKSIVVVIIYSSCHYLCAFLMALVMGAIFKDMVPTGQQSIQMPGALPAVESSYQQGQTPQEAMLAEAGRMKDKSDAKRREVEARVKEMEEGNSKPLPVPETNVSVAVTPVQAVKTPPAVVSQPQAKPVTPPSAAPAAPAVSNKVVQQKGPLNVSPDDWAAARKSVRVGGSMAGASGYMAMIDGRMYQQGEKVTHVLKGVRYRWKVAAISKDRVDLEPVDAIPAP